MVSGIVSFVQLTATQLALKAIEEQQAASCENVSSVDKMEADNAAATDFTNNTPLALVQNEDIPETDISSDIATSDFMNSLKAQLIELSRNPGSAAQGQAMLQALDSGTLKVFDPIEGIAVKAWDASADGQQAHSTTINAIGWSQFLKQHVKRDESTAYAKDESGNYIDAISGESAYFETVGSKYYYFTWSRTGGADEATVAA